MTNEQTVNLESLQSVRKKLEKLAEKINLDKPGRLEAELDSVASELLKSGLVAATDEALSLAEVLTRIKTKHPVPDEAIDAAKQLTYLIEADWYGENATDEEQQEAENYATVLYEKLAPLLDSYGKA